MFDSDNPNGRLGIATSSKRWLAPVPPSKNGGTTLGVIDMRIAEEQLSYTIPPEQRGYYELSSAIVSTAVKDYRRLKKVAHTRELERLRSFFLSELFENITGIENSNIFLMKLDEQIELEISNGIRRKREKQVMRCNG